MKVVNLKQHVNGKHDFNIELEAGEVEFLINLALDYLVDKEYISLNHELENYQINLLNELNPKEMFQA